MQNPIEVRKHTYSLTPRKGVGGKPYSEKIFCMAWFREYKRN